MELSLSSGIGRVACRALKRKSQKASASVASSAARMAKPIMAIGSVLPWLCWDLWTSWWVVFPLMREGIVTNMTQSGTDGYVYLSLCFTGILACIYTRPTRFQSADASIEIYSGVLIDILVGPVSDLGSSSSTTIGIVADRLRSI